MARTSIKNKIDDAAKAQAAKDAELLAALQARDKVKTAPAPSLGDNFISVASLIQQAHKDTHIAHVNLIKIWELTLMWALNNRGQQAPPVFNPEDLQEIGGNGQEGEPEDDAPTPEDVNEVIGESIDAPVEE